MTLKGFALGVILMLCFIVAGIADRAAQQTMDRTMTQLNGHE